MRKLFMFALLLLILTPLASVTIVRADREFDFAAEKTKLWSRLADDHADWGDDYSDEKLFIDAKSEFGRALYLEPENKKAMRGLGYKKQKDEWVRDQDDELPVIDGVEGDEATKAREKVEKKLERFIEDCVKRLISLADDCIEAGEDDSALVCYHEVVYYDPSNEQAQSARGYVLVNGKWIREVWKDFRVAGDAEVEKASAGLKDEAVDPQATKLGITLARRYSDYFDVRTQAGDTRSQRVHKVAVAARHVSQELLGEKDTAPFAWDGEVGEAGKYGRTMKLLGLNQYATYISYIDEYGPKDEKQRDFQKKLAGGPIQGAYGYFWREGSDAFGDDVTANQVARRILYFYRPKNEKLGTAEWIYAGFSYYLTARVLDTTITKYYTLSEDKSGGRTRAVRKKTGDEPDTTRNPNLTPDDFRSIIRYEVMQGTDIALPTLAETPLNEMTEYHAAKSFSFFEWLTENHAESMRAWLKDDIKEARQDLNKLAELLEMNVGDMDNAWRKWVLETYS